MSQISAHTKCLTPPTASPTPWRTPPGLALSPAAHPIVSRTLRACLTTRPWRWKASWARCVSPVLRHSAPALRSPRPVSITTTAVTHCRASCSTPARGRPWRCQGKTAWPTESQPAWVRLAATPPPAGTPRATHPGPHLACRPATARQLATCARAFRASRPAAAPRACLRARPPTPAWRRTVQAASARPPHDPARAPPPHRASAPITCTATLASSPGTAPAAPPLTALTTTTSLASVWVSTMGRSSSMATMQPSPAPCLPRSSGRPTAARRTASTKKPQLRAMCCHVNRMLKTNPSHFTSSHPPSGPNSFQPSQAFAGDYKSDHVNTCARLCERKKSSL